MGYYANSIEGNITILAESREAVLADLVKSYDDHNTSPDKWGNVELPTDLEATLTERGFDFMLDNDELVVYTFDNKWHVITEVTLHALLRHATPDSAMAFRGEDGEMWRFTKDGVQNATIVWS
jgi:hypothetical protein